ncbi:peptide-methionine (S)-S-oxide reductase MsrA [Sporolactobacillus laevolacticus]|uniref:Peptide methionine sulfoxide reductase MsrA n=1 Tax=Sporolactobacillus laevolacticus DSM 442 TaxID=1395513 RepID=V6IZN6_9BACL|nr:peptide-methionine (S)-S-oxide reductase MsrA [Sporolactobacillus laevolacticus]EST12301.1 methionine sulfoxide reductase A [Sporolactobacillus laevolacticus DSM 442]
MTQNVDTATFAGGCFWCMVKPFDTLPGIKEVVSGYIGGTVENPSYEQVKTGTTGHMEAIQVTFDPELFPYEKLLELYWTQVDPTDDEGQFFDRGSNYRTAIFYHDETQKNLAEKSKTELAASGRFTKPIVTRILPAAPFYPAEEEHQKFYKKHPDRYAEERVESGRDAFITEKWGKH